MKACATPSTRDSRRDAIIIALLALICSGACGRTDRKYFGTTDPKHGPDEVWTNLGTEPEYIDPGKCADSAGGFIIINTFAGLAQPDPVTLEARPDIASRWEVSEGGRRYTFYLRRTSWSDGVPLTAHDFVYSWRRVLDPKTDSKYVSFLFPIRNAEAFNKGSVPANALGVRAVDDYTLVVDLENPLPYFLDIVKFTTAMPVPRHVIERLHRQGKNPELWTRPEHIVSNGPYRLTEWKFRQRMLLEKNPHYWDAAAVKLQRVRLAMVENVNTALNLYEAGELDTIGKSDLPSELMRHLERYADFRRAPYLGTYFYWLNTKRKPFDDVRVRKALSLAIDRKALVEHVARGGQLPFADLVPAGLAGYEGPGTVLYDLERARALLKEAGYGPGRPLPPIVLTYNTHEGHKQLAEAVQQMWKAGLGIEVQLHNQEWKVYLKTLDTGDFQLARMGWIGDYPDPFTFLELLSSDNGNNRSGLSDPRYDELLRRANATQDRRALRVAQRGRDAGDGAAAHHPDLRLHALGAREAVRQRPHAQLREPFADQALVDRHAGGGAMTAFVIRRLLGLIPTLLVIVVVSFFVIRLAPGSPFSSERSVPPEVLAALEAKYGFDRPVHEQLLRYLGNLLQGDLGLSTKYPQRSVNEIIADGFPSTLMLGTVALAWALLLGLGAGVVGAVRQNTRWDYGFMTLAMVGISLPTFVLGPLLVLVFSLTLYWLPPAGWGELRHLVLPGITLGTAYAAYIARLTRGGMLEVVRADFVRTARAKGLPEHTIVLRHMLRGGLLPVVTFLGPAIANLLVGSVVVEKIFATPGIGPYFVDAAFNRDYFLVMGIVVLDSVFLLVMNLIVDVAYGFLDPRIRYD